MQETFFKKLILSMIVAAALAGVVEFYKVFIDGADQALNGKRGHTQFNVHAKPSPKP